MTFSADLDTDRDNVFLNTSEFAEQVTYTPADGSGASTISVVFVDSSDTVMDDKEIAYASVAEIAAPLKRDTVTRSGAVYTVVYVSTEERFHVLELQREELIQ